MSSCELSLASDYVFLRIYFLCPDYLGNMKYDVQYFIYQIIYFQDCIPMVNLAAKLQKSGIGAFRFDFAGNG